MVQPLEYPLKASALNPGDCIALVSPSGASPASSIAACTAYLQQHGYHVKPGPHCLDRYQYLAGKDAHRSADLMDAFIDPSVQAIFCTRGGYGTGRLLDWLDYGFIADNPKIVLGFSDTTALQLALFARTNLVCFTGALAGLDFAKNKPDAFTETSFWQAVTQTTPLGRLPLPNSLRILCPGRAQGPILGGCLSLVCSLIGTPYLPNFDGALLLLEDIGEDPYRLDRMLNQLRLAGILNRLNGLILGEFKNCYTQDNTPLSLSLEQIINDLAGQLDIPIVAGFPYGHFKRRLVVPLGIEAILDTALPEICLNESALG